MRINTPQYGNIVFNGADFGELRAISPRRLRDGYTAIVAGRNHPGDGQGGIFLWTASSMEPDDNATTIAPDALIPGRWCCQSNEVAASGRR